MGSGRFPFTVRPLPEGGFISRLRGRPPRENALIDLTNRLAGGVESVSEGDVREIEAQYGIDLGVSFPIERQAMYRSYVEFCYANQPIEGQPAELPHLRAILRLTEAASASIERLVIEKVYRAALAGRIADRRLDAAERDELDRLQAALALPQSVVDAIRQDEGDKVVRAYLNQAVEDAMLSPSEVAEIERAAADLGVTLRLTPEQQARWDRYRLYWQLQEGPLPPVAVSVNLYRNETCHFATPASWHERRQQTRTIRYGGPTARIRVAKGIYWRAGSIDVQRVTQEVLHAVDEAGTLFFTDRRVLYTGRNRNTTIRLNRILDFQVYSDGIELSKDAGRNPIFLFDGDIDIAALVLNRLLAGESL